MQDNLTTGESDALDEEVLNDNEIDAANIMEVDVIDYPGEKSIEYLDADFKRKFANKMLNMVGWVVAASFITLIVAELSIVFAQERSELVLNLSHSALEALDRLFPTVFSGLMGILGTVVGFYFASKGKK